MPFWAVAIIVLVLVVGYYLLTQQAKERRREKVGVDFAKTPNFYANQTYTDVHGEAAIGIDDRGRRIAIARKHAQPRTRVYSFAHIISVEALQNGRVIAALGTAGKAAGGEKPVAEPTAATQPTGTTSGGTLPAGGLYGSTKPGGSEGMARLPVLTPVLGQLTMAGVRVRFRNGEAMDEVLIRFYDGKPVNADGVAGERAFAEAQVLMGSLDIAIKRAGTPPRGPVVPKTPVL